MIIARAIEIAANTHAHQTDKGGHPYILHPLRVMLAVSPRARVVAVLHDVLEDGGERPDRLDGEEQEALMALTRRTGEAWSDYLGRVELSPLAVEVKLADLRDNMDMSRIPSPTPEDWKRYDKYCEAHERLWRVSKGLPREPKP